MKERIFKYLLEAGKGVAATDIFRDVFNINIRTPNTYSADAVVAGFLGADPRFACTEGLWHLSLPCAELIQFDFSRAVILHVTCSNHTGVLKDLRGAIRFVDTHIQEEFTRQTSIRVLSEISLKIEDRLLVAWSSREVRLWNALLQSKGLPAWRGAKVYLRNLAARVSMRITSKVQPEDLASFLGLSPADEARLQDVLKYLGSCWLLLLERIPAEFRRNVDSLQKWVNELENAVDFSRFAFGPSFLKQLPSTSGIYMMKDAGDTVLYVGKSRNLKHRVSSYFTPSALGHPKIARIHKHLFSIEIRRTENEIEALLLETQLIEDLRPIINMQIEIHERRTVRNQGRNLLLFVVEGGQKKVKIYFLRNGIFSGSCAAFLGRPPSKRLQDKLRSLFFSQCAIKKSQSRLWEKEIVSRWFKANQRRMNYLDIDEVENFEAVLARLQHYLHDPDQLAHKVYYR